MSGARLDTSAFRHYLRVRLGVTGPKGRLLRCEKRDGGSYWKVKLDSGEWVWPDGLIVDGPGDRVGTCGDCGLSFMSTGALALCPICDEAAFGTASRATEPAASTRVRWKHEDRGHGRRH